MTAPPPHLTSHFKQTNRSNIFTQEAPQELCAITANPAKYRDPKTGLAYSSVYAYHEIEKLKTGRFAWSDMLGCYVGNRNYPARGVPERFFENFEKNRGIVKQEATAAGGPSASSPAAS